MEAIFGMRHIASGTVEVLGKKVNIKKPEDAIDNSIGMITEDRRGTGILGCLSINDNTAIASYKNYTNNGVIDQKKVDAVVKDSIQKLNIKTPSGKTLIQSLSGGNQQKVLLAKWMFAEPDILILDEVLSVGDAKFRKKSEKKLVDMMDTGVTVLFVSHNLDQVKRICNKAMILEHGEMKAFGDIDEIAPVYEEMIE